MEALDVHLLTQTTIFVIGGCCVVICASVYFIVLVSSRHNAKLLSAKQHEDYSRATTLTGIIAAIVSGWYIIMAINGGDFVSAAMLPIIFTAASHRFTKDLKRLEPIIVFPLLLQVAAFIVLVSAFLILILPGAIHDVYLWIQELLAN